MTVDELIVKIQADTKDLRRKLAETNKHLNKIDKNSRQAGASMSAAFTKGKVALVAATAAALQLLRCCGSRCRSASPMEQCFCRCMGG